MSDPKTIWAYIAKSGIKTWNSDYYKIRASVFDPVKYHRLSPDDIVISREWLESLRLRGVAWDGTDAQHFIDSTINKIFTMGGKDE